MSDPPSLHDLAVHFGSAADAYERGRPDHPGEVVDHLREGLGLDDGAVVLDLGAGTGKLTKALTGAGVEVIALEPLAGMRELLARRAPAATVLDGLAERIPLPDGAVSAVTVADAFHWFDPGPALSEIRRVLVPGGGLAVLNALPDWSELEAGEGITALIQNTRPEHPFFDGPSVRERILAAPGWEESTEVFVSAARPASAEGILAYLASISFVAGLAESERAAWLGRAAALLEGTKVPPEIPFTFRIALARRD